MVERILGAATRVLVRDGYYDTSTNRIAREAGVSPGSVYQYFANKDEIIDSISRRVVGELAWRMEPVLRETAAMSAREAVPAVLGTALDVMEEKSGLLRALVDYVPAREQRMNLGPLRARLADRVHLAAVAAGGSEVSREDADRRTWIVVETCQTLLVRFVLEPTGFDREEFLADLSAMVLLIAVPGSASD